jgi:hypothetical protein
MIDDILNVRLQTLGIMEHCFPITMGGLSYNWKLYDVGGAVSLLSVFFFEYGGHLFIVCHLAPGFDDRVTTRIWQKIAGALMLILVQLLFSCLLVFDAFTILSW